MKVTGLMVAKLSFALVLGLLAPAVSAQSASSEDFWVGRDASVVVDPKVPAVRIAIWDSGVDLSLFPTQLARGADGEILVRGYDSFKQRQDTPMAVLAESVLSRQEELNQILSALDDRDSGVESAEAKEIARLLKQQTPAEAAEFDDLIGRWSGYVHGTALADIALAGLPHAEIVVARMEWWHGSPPVPCWNREFADREAESIRDLLAFVVTHGARVVNMSWGRAERAYTSNLEQCAPDMPADQRQALARYTVERIREVLRDGMHAAPDVLFVGAAGNAGSNMQAANPATRFNLPNFIMVGAVDRTGSATDWTNTGPEVTIYANGDRVAARLPGGGSSFPSGTSMAAPLVANAAAKILSVNPELSGAELRELLERTATTNATGQRLLHPRHAVEAARELGAR